MMSARTDEQVSDLLLEAIATHAPALQTIGRLASPADINESFKLIGVLASNLLDEMVLDWADRR